MLMTKLYRYSINFIALKSKYVTPRSHNNIILLLLIISKKVGNARPGESATHVISPKTPTPKYQPIE